MNQSQHNVNFKKPSYTDELRVLLPLGVEWHAPLAFQIVDTLAPLAPLNGLHTIV